MDEYECRIAFWLFRHAMVNEPWRAVVAGLFYQMFANKAAEMVYLMFAGAIATESQHVLL